MTDHDTLVNSSILTCLENLEWLEKGAMVPVYGTMFLGKTGFERSWDKNISSIHHGPVQ
jgi:hypothetical protein